MNASAALFRAGDANPNDDAIGQSERGSRSSNFASLRPTPYFADKAAMDRVTKERRPNRPVERRAWESCKFVEGPILASFQTSHFICRYKRMQVTINRLRRPNA